MTYDKTKIFNWEIQSLLRFKLQLTIEAKMPQNTVISLKEIHQFVKDVIRSFVPLFQSKSFHLGDSIIDCQAIYRNIFRAKNDLSINQ